MGTCHNCRSPIPAAAQTGGRPGKRSDRRRLEREALRASQIVDRPLQQGGVVSEKTNPGITLLAK